MHRRSSSRLALQQLETRLTPASAAIFVNGTLYISGDANGNAIMLNVGPGTTTIGFEGKSVASIANVKNIVVNAGNGNDSVNINLTTTLAGNLTVNGDIGNDVINVNGLSFNANISGVTALGGGAGDDQILINGVGSFLGLSNASVAGGPGVDQFDFRNAYASGFLAITGTEKSAIGSTNAPGFVKGNVVDQANDASPAIFSLNNGEIGTLVFTGGAGADTVNLGSGFNGLPKITRGEGPPSGSGIDGFVTLAMDDGDNLVNTAGVFVGGPLTTFHGKGKDLVGNGNDSVQFGAFSAFASDVILNLGNGNNSVTSDGPVFFGHDLRINAGKGNDTVRGFNNNPPGVPTNGSPFAAFIGNSFFTDLGNGDNTFNYLGFLGGNLAYNGGNGRDNVTIAGYYANSLLDVKMGAGSDTFTFGAEGALFKAAQLDFGADPDFYVDNGLTINFTINFIGQP
jgi:hypothetical protein